MEIIEYEEKYLEDVRDLLVELEEYIVSIDKDHLDIVGKDYREKMALYDLKEVEKNNGKAYLAVEDGKAIGLIMGILIKYDEADHLDYKCLPSGEITELIVSDKARSTGIGTKLMDKMEEYFISCGCVNSFVDVFAYNKNAIDFYQNKKYHSRMHSMLKRLK